MMNEKTNHPEKEFIYVPVPQMEQEDEIDLLELWNVIWKGKWFISAFTLLCTLVAVVLVLFVLPVTYKSNAVLQPTEISSGGLSKLASLAGSFPIPLNLPGGDDKSASILAFLKSRTLKIRLIEEFDLLPRLYPDQWNKESQKWDIDDPEDKPSVIMALQKEKLKKIYDVSQDKKTALITISWVDEDPEFAASMLNHVVDKLNYYLENEYESDAKREREFIEGQLEKAEKELEHWEQQVPSDKLTLSKIQRERLASQTVYAELRKQVELAKIAEVKEIIRFKVLDQPFVPADKFKPKRSMICALTLVISGFFAVLLIFLQQSLQNARKESNSTTDLPIAKADGTRQYQ